MITLIVTSDGTVQGLYTEAIDLTTLGRLRIRRASAIEFDNPAQIWRVFNAYGLCVHTSPSRQECLRWEQRHWQQEQEISRPRGR
jgi:hypothetical protein